MATIRKRYKKWQAIIRRQSISIAKSFWKKSDASKWAYRTEAQIETGTYLTIKKQERLNEIRLSELLDIFYDKTKAKYVNTRLLARKLLQYIHEILEIMEATRAPSHEPTNAPSKKPTQSPLNTTPAQCTSLPMRKSPASLDSSSPGGPKESFDLRTSSSF